MATYAYLLQADSTLPLVVLTYAIDGSFTGIKNLTDDILVGKELNMNNAYVDATLVLFPCRCYTLVLHPGATPWCYILVLYTAAMQRPSFTHIFSLDSWNHLWNRGVVMVPIGWK